MDTEPQTLRLTPDDALALRARGYARSYDEGSRSSGRSRRYVREASYERGSGYGRSGNSNSGTGHYTGGYATMY